MKHILCLALLPCLACGEHKTSAFKDETAPGTIRLTGSTTMFAGTSAAAAAFMAIRPDVKVSVSQSSSGAGIHSLIIGEADIANSSRPPSPREFEEARAASVILKSYQVGYDALALIVHPETGRHVPKVDRAQLRKIFFDGTITDWSELSPKLSGPIHVYVRDQATSGSADAFTRYITGRTGTPFVAGARMLESTTLLCPSIADDKLGIAFAPFGFADIHIAAKVDVATVAYSDGRSPALTPSRETIRSLSYPLRRDLYMITNNTPSGHLNDFIQFILHPDGQKVLQAAGIVGL